MARTFKEYVPTEQRMASAIAAVQSGKMSQRGAATEFGVAESTLRLRLKPVRRTTHPTKPQASTEVSPATPPRPSSKVNVHKELRALAKQLEINRIGKVSPGKAGPKQIYAALIEAGHDVPAHLVPLSLKTKTTAHEPPQQKLPVNDPLPVVPNGRTETDLSTNDLLSDDNPIFNDELDIDAVRQHVCAQVQQSDRPADFKRAIELLTELDTICTDAWYRRHPEPWGHDDWAHVSSEISSLHSIVWQRATETADELLRKSSAVKVNATTVN
jgi:transposase-like protein